MYSAESQIVLSIITAKTSSTWFANSNENKSFAHVGKTKIHEWDLCHYDKTDTFPVIFC